jgi:hypothetical protein
MKFFFGLDVRGKMLGGGKISTFLGRLVRDVSIQGIGLPAILFGCRFLELGLRKNDRDINRRVKLFR